MPRDLFRQVVNHRSSAPAGRLSAVPVSVAVHALVLTAVVVIPLVAAPVLPLITQGGIDWTPVVTMPSIPPSPAPPVHRTAPAPVDNAGAAPVEPPRGVTQERVVPSEAPVDFSPREVNGIIPGVPVSIGTVVPDAPPPVAKASPVPAYTLPRPPVRIKDVTPIYPETARLGKIEGVVVIEAVISPAGDVVETRVLKSKPLLAEAALAAVRQWKYTPTLLNGRPVPVVMTVTVNFRLQ